MARGNRGDELVDAADRLVQRQGFQKTTLAEVAGAAGVPAGNVYYYFKTKEQLGERLIEARARRYRLLRDAWEAEPDPKVRLRRFVQMTIDNRAELADSGCPI